MGRVTHSRIFDSAETSPVDVDLTQLIEESIHAPEYLQDLNARGMMALLSVEI